MGCIIPKDIVENNQVDAYLEHAMEPFGENLEVEPYVRYDNDELLDQYNDWKSKNSDSEENVNKTFEEWVVYWFDEELNEDGELESTWNPNGKWDWYIIGGRWDGYLTKNEPEHDGKLHYEDKYQTIGNNLIEIDTHLKNILEGKFDDSACYGLITGDGEWVESATMGWWGMTSDEKEESSWRDEYIKVLEKYSGDYILGVDCHV